MKNVQGIRTVSYRTVISQVWLYIDEPHSIRFGKLEAEQFAMRDYKINVCVL